MTAEQQQREAAALRRANTIAKVFDNQFQVPGTPIRFGYDAIIGLIPGLGDTVTAAISTAIVLEAFRLRVGAWPITKMLLNIGIDWMLGLIPGVDLVLDVAFKANARNADILAEALAKRSE